MICQVPCLAIREEQKKPFTEELLTLGQLQPLPRDPPWQQCAWPTSRRAHFSHHAGAACLCACLPSKSGISPRAGPVPCFPWDPSAQCGAWHIECLRYVLTDELKERQPSECFSGFWSPSTWILTQSKTVYNNCEGTKTLSDAFSILPGALCCETYFRAGSGTDFGVSHEKFPTGLTPERDP